MTETTADMETTKKIKRLRYSQTLIFLLGGFSGSALNLLVSSFLFYHAGLTPYVSFFCGTLCNELYHHVFYRVVFVNREIRMNTALPLQLFLYLCVAFGSVLLLSLFINVLKVGFVWAALLSIATLSLLNVLLIRISTFSSSELADIQYREMNGNYYQDQTDDSKVSRFRAWYHASRYRKLTDFVGKYYQPGYRIADLGCGNCLWNTGHFPVTGVDINKQMLEWAKSNQYLSDFRISDDLSRTGLPQQSFDRVIMSETLEHLLNIPDVMKEVHRILKKDGIFLVTVPYDFFLGPFFILFNLNCVYMGYCRGSQYHKYRCGHINHFTKQRLHKTLSENGFQIRDIFVVNGLLLYAAAEKDFTHR
jgi:ubiquinone/menaquinone biosynthesis C-methylase UbiE